MRMRKPALLGAVGLLLVGGVAYGGWQVTVTTNVNPTYGYASGQLANSRSSSIAYDYIYCSASANEGSAPSAWCTANSGSASGYCYTNDTELIAVIRSISDDSYVYFGWDVATGRCTSLQVTKGSVYAPKR